MQKKVIREGQGPVCPPGATVLAHYLGTLENGKKFDSSYDRNEPLQFKVGRGQVIKCWDDGITQMKQGEKAVLTCPHDYAYGARGIPGVIPPMSTLIFEVELLAFKEIRL
jgi:FKBP-type peptidyl-prolyl cis-trans isomerase